MSPLYSEPVINPKTIKNLKENYRRECISRDKYSFYSQKLLKAGYITLANLFSACSYSENIHATNHSRVALILGIKLETDVAEYISQTVEEILREMLKEEQEAMDDYSNFVKDAEEEHYESAVMTMNIALKADRTHYDILKEAAESHDYWKKKQIHFYICGLCGYLFEDSDHLCPHCGIKPNISLSNHDGTPSVRNWDVYHETEAQQRQALPDISNIWYSKKSYPTKLINAIDFTSDITKTLKKNDWPESEIYRIVLSVTEASVNANEHGNKGCDGKEVHVECAVGNNFFFCSIQDEGDGFDPKDVPNPCLDENCLVAHGRGLKLISNLMTLLWFNDKGDKVFMLKKR